MPRYQTHSYKQEPPPPSPSPSSSRRRRRHRCSTERTFRGVAACLDCPPRGGCESRSIVAAAPVTETTPGLHAPLMKFLLLRLWRLRHLSQSRNRSHLAPSREAIRVRCEVLREFPCLVWCACNSWCNNSTACAITSEVVLFVFHGNKSPTDFLELSSVEHTCPSCPSIDQSG